MNTSDLIRIDCRLCGCMKFDDVYPDGVSRIVKCTDCGLVFYNPLPSADYLRDFYSSQNGYLSSIEENLRSYEANPKAWDDTANWILHKIHQHIPEKMGQRLLDIGSAYGFFLMFAKKCGLDVMGLEISTETSEYARRHGIEVLSSSLTQASLDNDSFDIVTMNNVLEHTLDPLAELQKAHSILKSSGILYIGVPNWDSLVCQVDGYHWKMKSWPNHLFYFTAETLTRMVTKAGFTVKESFTHMGESDYGDDARIIRDRLLLSRDEDIRRVAECLWSLGKGQELVMIARKN
jgi:2-polyprenyl-3-methyl-5-hydroxy-6-metoxy-1,4-benzoquinol methylase